MENMNITIVGPRSVGKSTISKMLSVKLGYKYLESDDLMHKEMKKHGLGFVQVFWGNGKGKTTSALGSALRACGNGFRVLLIQFMKAGADSLEQQIPGEIIALEKFDTFSYKRFGAEGWVIKKPTEKQIVAAKKGNGKALEIKTATLEEDIRFNVLAIKTASGIEDADQIVVLDHGKIAEQGEHKELLVGAGKYASLVGYQSAHHIKENPVQESVELSPA